MSEPTVHPLPQTAAEPAGASPPDSIVDAVFDVATAWAAVGLDKTRGLLEKSAGSLSRTAEKLGRIADEIQPNRAA
ncbi:MAG: hypothetical protein JNL38_38835 [Myxococcales bacterium]|jgi:hypothetical protein|nr:hypothetical protein [Myxococcales bacterium]